LHEQERLVTTISAAYPAHSRTGIFAVLASCPPDKTEAAREAIIREVTTLATEKPTAAEMARAKRLLTNEHLFGRETTSGHTASLGYHHTLTGDPTFDDKYADLVAKVTMTAVKQGAREYLTARAPTTVAIHPADRPLAWGSGA
jgi:predicted Zn-dependent peptidase